MSGRRVIFIAVVLAGGFGVWLWWSGWSSVALDGESRVARARKARGSRIAEKFRHAALPYPPREIFLRAFKREGELELWAREDDGPFRLVEIFRIVTPSGGPGPKRREGDRQVPEGFYVINRFNPDSLYHLSLGLNYPNASDRLRSDREHPGSDIFIHGRDRTIGCLPLGDAAIEELYLIALDTRARGAAEIAVHIFPAHMSGATWKTFSDEHVTREPALAAFWEELRPGYEAFETQRLVPGIRVESDGAYRVASAGADRESPGSIVRPRTSAIVAPPMNSPMLLLALLFLTTSVAAAAPAWPEILSSPQNAAPAAVSGKVIWQGDLKAAMAEARRSGRPLFVTFRCIPCKQCADFDKEVLEGGPALDPWLSQFIPVRLTDARQMDLRIFLIAGFQDLDLSWWGWFLSPSGELYGVYGGRDEVSDATRISAASLVKTMQRVLAHHANPGRTEWKIDGPAADLLRPRQTPEQLPGFAAWEKKTPREALQLKDANCIHCHMVADILRTPAIEAKTFDKVRDTQVWPLPENVGIAVDRDDGLLVKAVAAGSAAEQAGVRVGDVLAAAEGRRLFSQTDFRAALHRGPAGAGNVEVWWLRDGRPMQGAFSVADGWRKTVLDWRMSISQGAIGIGPGFFPLKVPDAKRQQLGIAPDEMAVSPFMGKDSQSYAALAGVRNGHVITAVNGQSPNVFGRGFLVWFRMQHDAGDTVTIEARDAAGQKQEFRFTLRGREW